MMTADTSLLMWDKVPPGDKGRIPYLLRNAFREANEGDKDAALAAWNLAIHEGYEPRSKTKKSFFWTLKQNRDDRQKADPEPDPSPPAADPCPGAPPGPLRRRIKPPPDNPDASS